MPASERTAGRVVGVKQTRKALLAGQAVRVFVAGDAERRIAAPIEELCRQRAVEVVSCPTMAELGQKCGIRVGAAVAAELAV